MKQVFRNAIANVAAKVAMLGVTFVLASCGSEDDTAARGSADSTRQTTARAADLAQESGRDYADNANGVISGNTLQGWLDDWMANRPDGISGNLIVLQVADGYRDDIKYVKPNPAEGIYVYSLPSSAWVMTRSNGVVETNSMVLDGPRMDGFLQYYAIDPSTDMIVFVAGTGGNFQNMLLGRGWYLFRYWGTEASHLAILNGSIAHALPSGYLGNTASVPPGTGTATVKDLLDDNTQLQVTLGELLDAAKTQNANILIWDARSAAEYNGDLRRTGGVTGRACGDIDGDGAADDDYSGNGVVDDADRQCYTAFEGHPRGAVNLEFVELLINDDGTEDFDGDGSLDASYRYKDKTVLADLVDGLGYQPGQTIYTYCRTTYRAMITGIAAGVILGYPVRYYDGAMVEWLQMANWANRTGAPNLPETSPWRTDLVTASTFSAYNASATVEPATIVDAYAPTSDAVITEDRSYKSPASAVTGTGIDGGSGTTSSGSVAPSLPANPCGG